MEIFNQLIDFLKLLFSPGNPEIQKNQQLKAIDTKLAKAQPVIYKNGMVLPAFAEALFSIYSNIGPFNALLEFIQMPEQKLIKNRVYDALIKTGYNEETQKKVESLTYEMRKHSLDANLNREEEMNKQAQIFLSLQKDLNTTGFAQIEKTLQDLELFYDLTAYNFIDILKLFNPAFSPLDTKTQFNSVDCEALCEELLNFYYISAKINLTGSLARAIIAVSSLVPGKTSVSKDQLTIRLKKIASALTKILNTENLKDLIILGKKDANISPEVAQSKATPLEEYALRQKNIYNSDTERLNVEYQDQERVREIKAVFGEKVLLPLEGYNTHVNGSLQSNSSFSFLWITPVQVIKTFAAHFLNDGIQSLLNDIVVEGFFNFPETKTDFSSAFFECSETAKAVQAFENSFARNEKNDIALLSSYIKDSQKDPEFVRTLGNMVSEINNAARDLIQIQVTNIYELYNLLLTILEDSRRSTPELISNIKFLFTSSRNRETVDLLDKSMPKWAAFLNLMRHYAQLGIIQTSREEKRQEKEQDIDNA